MTQDMTPSKKMTMAALVLAIVAVIALFLPMFSVSAYGYSAEVNGYDIIDGEGDLAPYVCIGFAGAVVAGIFAFLGLKDCKKLIIAAISAAAGGVSVFLGVIMEDFFDYADIGFWLFVIAAIGAAVLSEMAAKKAKTE